MGRLSRVAGCNQSHKISCQRHVSWLPSVSAMPQQPGNAWNNQQDSSSSTIFSAGPPVELAQSWVGGNEQRSLDTSKNGAAFSFLLVLHVGYLELLYFVNRVRFQLHTQAEQSWSCLRE